MNLTLMIIVIAVLLLSGGAVFIIRKFKVSYVNVLLSVVTFVRTTLINAGWTNGDVNVILEMIIQSLTYVQAISSTGVTVDLRVADALSYIEKISKQFDVTFTDSDIAIIKTVLKLGFIFMDSIGIDKAIKTSNLMFKYVRPIK